MNPTSKKRQDLFKTVRRKMLTKYDKLIKPTQQEALEALKILQLMVCNFKESVKTPYYSLIQLMQAKKRRMGKDKEVEITLNVWLESIKSRAWKN
ncbi:hypothetical protein MXB_2296 [Myxobolus squamalis]|nr:hypothetical protein MXB_2296 [Myxobolus squamalis]